MNEYTRQDGDKLRHYCAASPSEARDWLRWNEQRGIVPVWRADLKSFTLHKREACTPTGKFIRWLGIRVREYALTS